MTTFVLLPGLHGTAALFDPFLDHCASHIQTIVIEYPTHQKCSYEEIVGLVCQRLKAIEGECVILGESFSGPVALRVANVMPEKIKSVVLVATFILPPYPSIFKYMPWNLGFYLAKPLYKLRALLARNVKNKHLLDKVSIEMQKVAPAVMADRVASALQVSVGNELQNIKQPILYVKAKYDYVVPFWNLNKIVKINPNVQVVEIKQQHFVLQASSEEAWSKIKLFVLQ